MSNKKYNNFYNQKSAETPNTPAEEIKELEQELTEGEENLNVDEIEEDEENPEDEIEEDEENLNVDEIEEVSKTKTVKLVRVTVGSLNVRDTADKESDIITVVKKDDELELRESTSIDGFYAVKTKNGTFGYCMVDFVELV